MALNLLKQVESIKESLDRGEDYKNQKRNFFKIVDFIKTHEIKDEKIISKISEIRRKMSMKWRPRQYTIRSGLLLWVSLIFLGSVFIYLTFLITPFELVPMILYIFCLVFGWLTINMGVHNLGHYIGGSLVGIQFNSWVIREKVFQWALMIDYNSYLKSTFRRRQILHVSGPICTLGAPWIIYFITMNPIMIGIGIYMFVASVPVIIKKKLDYGRIFKERRLKKQAKQLKNKSQ